MPDDRDPTRDRSLWERYARGVPGPGACPPLIELAAWVDDRATAAEAEAVETHLAACGVCREAVTALRLERDAVAGRVAPAPPAVVAAAKALVEATPDTGAARRRRRPADWLAPPIGPGGWGVAAAASIAICFVGYRIGSLRPVTDGTARDETLVNEMSFGLLNGGDDELLLVLEAVR